MNILGLVPARQGSKRLPNKNMATIQDETLVARALRIASEASVFAQIACSTDSEAIAQHIRELGFEVILRPPEIATDTSRDVEWVNHALWALKEQIPGYDILDTTPQGQPKPWEDPPKDIADAFCILRPTSPFRTAETIQRAVKQFEIQPQNIDSLRAVQPVSERPEKMWRLLGRRDRVRTTMYPYEEWMDDWPRLWEQQSSSFEDIYIQNGCIEIAHTHVLPNSVSGDRIAPFFTEGREGFDINTIDDLEYARYLAEKTTQPKGKGKPYPWPIPLPTPTTEAAGER